MNVTGGPTSEVPHDVPSVGELLGAVEGFLRDELLPATEGRLDFHVRVAANVLSIVARQLELGPAQADAHAARLVSLGVASEAELAEAIRSGALDDRLAEVRAAVQATVADKLAVANPRYLQPAGPPDGDSPTGGPRR